MRDGGRSVAALFLRVSRRSTPSRDAFVDRRDVASDRKRDGIAADDSRARRATSRRARLVRWRTFNIWRQMTKSIPK